MLWCLSQICQELPAPSSEQEVPDLASTTWFKRRWWENTPSIVCSQRKAEMKGQRMLGCCYVRHGAGRGAGLPCRMVLGTKGAEQTKLAPVSHFPSLLLLKCFSSLPTHLPALFRWKEKGATKRGTLLLTAGSCHEENPTLPSQTPMKRIEGDAAAGTEL